MLIKTVRTYEDPFPADDHHPYRTGAWRPNFREYDADDLVVTHGKIPEDLEGVYLRNTENPLLPSLGRYHPFDGDGMLHAIRFAEGKAYYRNRMVATKGLAAELQAKEGLWAGIIEGPQLSKRDGWGARTRMKDASSTDVVVHRGKALTSFFQCGELYATDPVSLEPLGVQTYGDSLPSWGVSAHTKVDEHTGELLYFSYATEAPFMRYGVIDRHGRRVHEIPIALPGPRLPHDMAFTEHYTILNDFPVFWDEAQLAAGKYRARVHELPSRFAIVPRHGKADEVRWFEAAPTYALHFTNAYEEGDEIVLEGYPQTDPMPRPDPKDGPYAPLLKMLDLHALGCHAHRWRFNLKTGKTREERLSNTVSEFPMINGRYGGRRHRYSYAALPKPGWFLFSGLVRLDNERGEETRFEWPDGVYGSEAPMAPRRDSAAEDDGYVVTFVSDTRRDTSECQVFDARRISDGPIACVALPERICSGTHSVWAPKSMLEARDHG